jgi:serine/threonine protein kinase
MELVDGVELDTLVQRGRIRPQLAFQIAYQVCGALVEAHSAGIIHRDLKAENLVLVPVSDGSLEVKVLDFGIALPQETNERLTQTGRIYGTPQYMAPEQAQGLEVDGRTDLFALGAILFEMFVGHLPTGGSSSIEVLLNRVQKGVPRLSEALPEGSLPQPAVDLVESLASKSPDDRPDDARAAREQIRALRQSQGWSPVTVDLSRNQDDMFEPWLVSGDDLDVPLVEGGAETTADSPTADGGTSSSSTSDAGSPTKGNGTKQGPNALASTDDRNTSRASDSEGDSSVTRPNDEDETASTSSSSSKPSRDADDSSEKAPSETSTTEANGSNEPATSNSEPDANASSSASDDSTSSNDETQAPPPDGTGGSPSSGHSGGGNGGGVPSSSPEGGNGGDGGPSIALIGCIGALVLGLLTGGGVIFASRAGYLDGLGLGGLLSGSDDTEEKDSDSYTDDPVCGNVEQADLPSGWTGTYQNQDDEDDTLDFGEDELAFEWPMGRVKDEGTLWLAQTSQEGRTLEIECARLVTSDGEEECTGTMTKRGPILNINLDGAEMCEEKMSRSWGKN